jgi:predicted nucleic acid-binding protein
MRTVLDSGGLTALALDRVLVNSLRRKGHWPPVVPADVLAESLTGDHRRDFQVNRLLRACAIRDVTEIIARRAAALRYADCGDDISAVDAVVVATADHTGGGVVWTSDPKDLEALAANAIHRVDVTSV